VRTEYQKVPSALASRAAIAFQRGSLSMGDLLRFRMSITAFMDGSPVFVAGTLAGRARRETPELAFEF
jgi:hypothetical protein